MKEIVRTWLEKGKETLQTKWPKGFNIVILFVFAVFMPILVELVANGYSVVWAFGWAFYHPLQYINTVLFIFLFTLTLYLAINRTGLTIFISGILFSLFASINYYKLFYRSEPLFPWDFISFREAAEISSSINIKLSLQIIVTVLILLAVWGICSVLNRKKIGKNEDRRVMVPRIKLRWKQRIVACVLSLAALSLFTATHFFSASYMTKHHVVISQWRQQYYYTVNGLIPSFLMNVQYTKAKEPDNYKKKTVNEIVDSIVASQPESDVKPNIIIMQDESYGDASLWKDVEFDQPIDKEVAKLKKSNASGTVLTSSFAGGTSVSEFEVLTGFSHSFLPSGSTPYQQYCNQALPSYVSYLRDQGYETVAVHSYGRNFWNRNVAYKSLGFDKFYAEDNFVNPQTVRDENRITDLETIKKTISAYEENKSTGKPFFNLTVTMQNHQAYNTNEYPDNELVKVTKSNISPDLIGNVQTYATGLRDANIALKYLIDYFSKVKEPTIIVFYGDHLAKVEGSVEDIYIPAGYIQDTTSAESTKLMHSPPFVMWDNYKHVKAEPVSISMYQLIPYMTHLYGLSKPLYFDYLTQQSYYYKGQALDIYLDANGNAVRELPTIAAQKYNYDQSVLQYNIMFGKSYDKDKLYAQKKFPSEQEK